MNQPVPVQGTPAEEIVIKALLQQLQRMPHLVGHMAQQTDPISTEVMVRWHAWQAGLAAVTPTPVPAQPAPVPVAPAAQPAPPVPPAAHPWANTPVPDDATLNKLLSKAKAALFVQSKGAGFLGSLMSAHQYVWDPTHSTAWDNGQKIGFNPAFFMWLHKDDRVLVLAHELMHTGFDHLNRRGDRHPKLWNQAADYVINLLLKDWGFDFNRLMCIQPCLDEAYRGMTTEQVYDELLIQMSSCPPQQGDVAEDDPDEPLLGDVRPSPDPAAAVDVKLKQVQAIQAAEMAKEAGSLPGEIKTLVDTFLNPILPWETLLARFYQALSKDDFSWKRPSRRYDDEYLPSLDGENGLEHLIYYVDVSGSVTDGQMNRFLSEVHYIHQNLRPTKLTLVTFDDDLQSELTLNQDDPFEKIEITGRGGTSFLPVYEHIRKHRPTAAVIFSDLGVWPHELEIQHDPGVPLLWVVMNNVGAKTLFGKQIHITVDD